MYVCNMHVSTPRSPDPLVNAVAEAVAPSGSAGAEPQSLAIVLGPPGFGKSSVLSAATALSARRLGARVVWVNGAVVASEGHLARLLSSDGEPQTLQANGRREAATEDIEERHASITSLEAACTALETSMESIVVAIDDFDALVFKREGLAERLARMASTGNVCLIASCKAAGGRRLIAKQHRFAATVAAHGGRIASVWLTALDHEAARALIRRRAPRLSEGATQIIIDAAGGHPAALVFLSRLTELSGRGRRPRSTRHSSADIADLPELFARAAEFAGTVYAESWAALGPQQRAVLWQLSTCRGPTTAADIAQAIALSPSHVSAQLTRLVGDGLVRRTGVRGQFVVAPLLAEWIVRRAARAGTEAGFATTRADPARDHRPPSTVRKRHAYEL